MSKHPASPAAPPERTPLERALIRRRLRLMPPEQRTRLEQQPAQARRTWEDMTLRASWRQLAAMETDAQRRDAVDRLAQEDCAHHVPDAASRRLPARRARERRSGTRRRNASSSRTSGSDPGDSDSESGDPEPAAGRLCAARTCSNVVYGPPQKAYCGTDHCTRTRAKERQQESRKNKPDDLSDREKLTAARLAGYVGANAFALGWAPGSDAHAHALSFQWKYGVLDGGDPGEVEALRQRTCRCNGHHIDGGTVGCFKCGLPRVGVMA